MTRLACFAALLLAMACATATAQAAHSDGPGSLHAPAWHELTREQQADLSGLARRWDRIPEPRRRVILERHAHWKSLPPPKREALRDGARNFRQMSPRQREQMRISMQALRALPRHQQAHLRQLWRSMTPQQRRRWLARGGPGIAPPP